jgi:N-glycosylase/DNA lyase
MANTIKKLQKITPKTPELKEKISKALNDFKKTWEDEEKVFEELCYCLLTPQSSAKQAMKSINALKAEGLLLTGNALEKEKHVKSVRFFRTKAKRLEEVVKKFIKIENANTQNNVNLNDSTKTNAKSKINSNSNDNKKSVKFELKKTLMENGLPDAIKCREFLVKEINGYGMKEASHFLRNVGFFEDISILDRHILRNLQKHKVINEIPKTITKKNYIEIENKMKEFCKKQNLKMEELDLIFWSNETGEVLK